MKWERLVRIQRHQTERALRFAQRLSEMEDVEGNILENSIILFTAATWVTVMCMVPISCRQLLFGKGGGIRVASTCTMRLIHLMPTSSHTILDRAGIPG